MEMRKKPAEHLNLRIEKKSVPLAYVAFDDEIYVISSGTANRWPSEVLRHGIATVYIDGKEKSVAANLVSDADKIRKVKLLMEQKYGSENYARWFSNISRVISLKESNDKKRIKGGENYNRWLTEEFNSIAHDYDHHIYGNFVNNYLRERSVSLMKGFFSDCPKLMEIGSGTGTETIAMLREGHEITAVDISEKMNQILLDKAKNEHLGNLLKTLTMKASDLETHVNDLGEESFDGIYSNYGALNCEPDLEKIMIAFNRILKPGGKLVFGIFNKLCLTEMIAHVIGIKPKRVFERLSNMVPEGSSRFCIDVFPYSPMYLRRLFARWFTIEEIYGCPVMLPPSNYASIMEGRIDAGKIKKADIFFSDKWPFKYLGDHTLYFLSKK